MTDSGFTEAVGFMAGKEMDKKGGWRQRRGGWQRWQMHTQIHTHIHTHSHIMIVSKLASCCWLASRETQLWLASAMSVLVSLCVQMALTSRPSQGRWSKWSDYSNDRHTHLSHTSAWLPALLDTRAHTHAHVLLDDIRELIKASKPHYNAHFMQFAVLLWGKI